MNYIEQLNSFYELIEQHPISIKAFRLYHQLLHINNTLFWRDRFVLPNSRLVNSTGIDDRTFDRVRNELIQKGLIEYKRGKGNQAGEYKIVKLYTQNDIQDDLTMQNDRQNNLILQNDIQNDLILQNDRQIAETGENDIQNGKQNDKQNGKQNDNINKTINNKTNDLYNSLLKNARDKFDVSTFDGKIKALSWAKEQEEWNDIPYDMQCTFIHVV